MTKLTINDIIREAERINFRHVNDTERERPCGQLTIDYCWAMTVIAVKLRQYEPDFQIDCTEAGVAETVEEWRVKGIT